ncbi:E3 ubiquitin-protein ligase COP1-like isoform X1 [Thrips palmi]|uniref:E3 ubiquitin-protein ligase COP1-like isoform X1 n=1 Tax=Thrips palmi TaxID=161013 RepID=A0A6P8YBJ2_THRPL|nr:E3 ubiquitin-protein ligase COP1-like isoform X1 [Thrips palmi]
MASNSPSSSSHNTTHQRSRPTKRQHPAVLNGVGGSFEDKNNDYLCPICFELIQEAHITRCGHTFCHQCIAKSLESSGRCPKCSYSLGSLDNVFPNYLLNELISKFKAKSKVKNEFSATSSSSREWAQSPVDGLREFVSTESRNLTLPDVNVILELLTQRKSVLEAESSYSQNKLLHEFLEHLLRLKESQLDLLNKEVSLIKHDMSEVDRVLKDCTPGAEDICVNLESRPSSMKSKKKAVVSNSLDSSTPQEETVSQDSEGFNEKRLAGSIVENRLASRRKRMHTHFDDFVQCYLNIRAKEVTFGRPSEKSTMSADTGSVSAGGLDTFRENLVKFSRYNYLRPLATLNYSSDIFNNSTIVSSIEFDKDNEFFAIAGVTKRIKVFEYGSVIRDVVDIHYPCVEMTSTSKISCIIWNSYHKNVLASSDYEGAVTVWDAATGQRTKTFQEHEKRCWSVDFNAVDSRLIASGSDDARVKLWNLNMENSVASLEAKANVCCVKFNPCSSFHLAFGSADHCVHYYDLRNMKEALMVFKGHRKAVSYVKFLNKEDIVSASTDSQLKMWNVNNLHCLRSFVGHTNEKNFVGLATDGDYIACGSENNSLYVYYKGLTKQLFSFKFDAVRSILEKDRKEDDVKEFVSAVCWRQNSNVVVSANSQGIIKILELV